MTPAEAIPIKRIEVVELQPGDTVIVHLPDDTTWDIGHEFQEELQDLWPDQHVLVAIGVSKIEVHRPEAK